MYVVAVKKMPFSSRGPARRMLLLLLLPILTQCSPAENEFVVHRQVTGPGTNTYLLYDVPSREAALFDVAGSMDSLAAIIEQEGLDVKYIFTTHAHQDHVFGIPAAQDRYPDALWGMSGEELEYLPRYTRYEEELPEERVAQLRANLNAMIEQNPALAEIYSFDLTLLGHPDLILEDGQVHRLGELEIHTFLTPGHSVGGICFHVGDVLFSGDVLSQGYAGGPFFPSEGAYEAVTISVGRLYEALPDETKVYPGHGEPTEIGTEKSNGTGLDRASTMG